MDPLFILFTSMLSFLLGYLRHVYNYWRMLGMQQQRTHFLYGNFFRLKSLHLEELLQETYDAFKGTAKVAGTYVFTKPIAVVTNLDLIQRILMDDSKVFEGTEELRLLRDILTSNYTADKMKIQFKKICEVAKKLESLIGQEIDEDNGELEADDLLGRYTTDVISNCILGIECNSLLDPHTDLWQLFHTQPNCNVRWQIFKMTYPSLFKGTPQSQVTEEQVNFFNQQSTDFSDLFLNHKETSMEKICALYKTIFESCSSLIICALYELARNEKIQQKVRKEIQRVLRRNNQLTYEAVLEMKYLDQVITETLRKYPSHTSLIRIANEDYELPDDHITIERNIPVHIPVLAVHHDPDIYPQPNTFQPERFDSSITQQQRHSLAFLGSHCLGSRFARLPAQVGLISLLRLWHFSALPETPVVLTTAPTSILRRPIGCVRLRLKSV